METACVKTETDHGPWTKMREQLHCEITDEDDRWLTYADKAMSMIDRDDIWMDEMEGQSEGSYTDEETGEETREESRENYNESEKEDNNPWKLILNEVYQKMDPIRDASIEITMQEDEFTLEEATKHVYVALNLAYSKELMKVYKKYLRLLKGLQRDSTHRKLGKLWKV